ncbi:hypothetical protein Mth01_22760 [Sphaerimonospora thailandensis]|uniref:Uncharacterized protein n=1 Tax=Sphaerimonospora thailandensis TaxID=795644 RepID=A0A8J3VZG0_9ACTN|nr:hypothetical protein Mth01_22760 [Sphaerimonospora thailandensis]
MEASACTRGVLYVVACAAPAAADVHTLVGLAREAGWQVHVVTTPMGTGFVDIEKLKQLERMEAADLEHRKFRSPATGG